MAENTNAKADNTAKAESNAPKALSQQALAREVLARRVKTATEAGLISPTMKRGIDRMTEFVRKGGK